MNLHGCFITGTGTGIGKTCFTAWWTRQLRRQKCPALALKPITCGGRGDAETFALANDETLSLNEINPVWLLPPVAPYTACVIEDKPLDMLTVRNTLDRLSKKFPGPWLIEGIGGWLVPLEKQFWVRDWAFELGLPVVVVASAGLGTLNHTLLTVESIRQSHCPILGLVINHYNVPEDMATQTNPAIIEDLTGLPIFNFPKSPGDLPLPPWLQLSSLNK